ncbi:MAG: hypothetical protein P4L40_12280 [Terracidiphilus sp.]|nr:hypothetical protein [Terracidiphilus sp.]
MPARVLTPRGSSIVCVCVCVLQRYGGRWMACRFAGVLPLCVVCAPARHPACVMINCRL